MGDRAHASARGIEREALTKAIMYSVKHETPDRRQGANKVNDLVWGVQGLYEDLPWMRKPRSSKLMRASRESQRKYLRAQGEENGRFGEADAFDESLTRKLRRPWCRRGHPNPIVYRP